MITISNNNLSVKILEKGAELQSIQHNGYEYLWQANGKYWPKHSPVLFPVIGELKNGFYIFEEKEYKMSRHGFARDKIFKVTQADHNTASFTLYSDEQSLAIYPFHFIFNIDYKVEGNNLSCTYTVENNGNKTMYFSAGGHPAFNVPLNDKLEYSDYFLRFDDDTILSRYLLSDGLISNDI